MTTRKNLIFSGGFASCKIGKGREAEVSVKGMDITVGRHHTPNILQLPQKKTCILTLQSRE